jgi:predicted dehydrogenase
MAAAVAAPYVLPSNVWAAETSPNAKKTIGFIGMGTQSRGLLGNFLSQDVKVVAVCDVDKNRREDAKSKVDQKYKNQDCQAYNDFRDIIDRKDIDMVCIATPDHWHAIPTIMAMEAGKDVYCEKPLTHDIQESIDVMATAKKTNRVLQTGSMQRSMKEFRVACELVQNGVIGKIKSVECDFKDPAVPCNLPEEPAEPGLDWDRWCGPAPLRPYNSVLSPRGIHKGYPNWRAFKEYGGGRVCDWGAHHLDIAQWGLGMDESGPVEIRPPEKSDAKRGCTLVYTNGVTVIHVDGFGVRFIGEDGEVLVNRGRFRVILKNETTATFENGTKGTSCEREVALMEKRFLNNAKIRLYNSKGHIPDFLDCVGSRKKPITNEIVGSRSAICCHLMNLSYWHRQVMKWDPATSAFTGGTGDAKWLVSSRREDWKKKG